MKITFSQFISILCFIILSGSGYAATEVTNGIQWTYSLSGGYAVLGGSSQSSACIPTTTSGDVIVPDALGGYPVTLGTAH